MIKRYLFITMLFIVTCNNIYAQQTFQAYFPQGYHDDYYSRLQRAANGDMLLQFQRFVYEGSTGKNSGVIVSRRNASGGLIWSKHYSQPVFNTNTTQSYGTVLFATKSNGFLLVTTIRKSDTNFINAMYSYFVVKCDSNGNIVWKELLNAPFKYISNNHNLNIGEASDEGIYLVPHDLHNYFHVIKLKKDGVLLWAKTYPSGGTIFNSITSVTVDKYNNLILVMSKAGCEGYCSSSYLQKIDKEGNTVWGANTLLYDINSDIPLLVTYGNNRIEVILRIKTDDVRRLVCWSLSDDKKDSKAVAIKDDIFALKDFLKRNHFESAKNKLFNFEDRTYYLINDDWSLTQVEESDGYPEDSVYFRKYDTLDRICPDYTIPKLYNGANQVEIPIDSFHYSDLPYEIEVANYNITVSDYNIPFTQICSASAPFATTGKQNNFTASITPDIKVYPNPVTNILTISGLKNYIKTTVQIINVNGTALKEITSASSTLTMDVHSLAPGPYLIRVGNGREFVTRTFIKQ